jgi:hypothetical protein
MEVNQMLIWKQSGSRWLNMLTWFALCNLNCDVWLVYSILLVIIFLLIDINLVFLVVFSILLFVRERSAGFFLGFVFVQMFEVLFKIVLVIFFKFNFIQVLNQRLLLFALISCLRIFLSL